jgi:CYTH domain-containing protein
MGQEIERKYLVTSDAWHGLAESTFYRQGYLSTVKERVVRVRTVGKQGYLTIKGVAIGATRPEFEYEIPWRDAEQLLALCERPLIEKTRYRIEHGGLIWELDVFHGDNDGLVTVECELETEDQKLMKPDWVGEEVTGDPRYFNANLVENPYQMW